MSFNSTLNCFSASYSCACFAERDKFIAKKYEQHIVLTSNPESGHGRRLSWRFMFSEEFVCLRFLDAAFSRFNKILYIVSRIQDAYSYSNTLCVPRADCYIPRFAYASARNSHSCFHLRLLLILITFSFHIYFSFFASFFSATSFININCHVHNGLRVSLSFGTITFRSFYYRHRHFGKIFIRSLFGELVMRCCTVRIVSHTHREKTSFITLLRWDVSEPPSESAIPIPQRALYFRYFNAPHFYCTRSDPICMSVLRCLRLAYEWLVRTHSTLLPLDSFLLQSIYSRSINSNCTHAPLSTAQIYELKLLLSATYAAHRKIVKKNLSPEHTFFPS